MLLKEMFEFSPKSKRNAAFGQKAGRFPFFTSSNIVERFVNAPDYSGEYLIIGDGGTGNCKYYKGEFSVSDHNYLLRPKKGTNALCVKYFLMKDGYKVLNDGFKGVGIKNVSKKYIESIDYAYNKNFSENEIVTSLQRVESLIDEKNKQITALDSLAKSRFMEMFGEWNLSFQKENWIKLSDLTNIYTGTTPKTEIEEYWNGLIPWVTPAELDKDSYIITDTERHSTEKGQKSKSLTMMPVGTVLLSTRAPIGKVAICGVPMTCNQGFKNFECLEKLHPTYLFYLLKLNNDWLQTQGTGTTFKEISKSKAGNIKIPVPTMSDQKDVAQFYNLVDKSRFVVHSRYFL